MSRPVLESVFDLTEYTPDFVQSLGDSGVFPFFDLCQKKPSSKDTSETTSERIYAERVDFFLRLAMP